MSFQVYVSFMLLFLGVAMVNILNVDGIVNTIDDICDDLEACSSEPCDCQNSDDMFGCKICHDGTGCSQCDGNLDGGYFRANFNSKCVAYDKIYGCKHFSDGSGCQQCDTSLGCSNQPVKNSCDVYVCDCDGFEDPVTPSPVPAPTSPPTMLPTADVSDTPGIQTAFTDLLTGANHESVSLWFTSDAVVCWGDYDCDNGETLVIFSGICNEGTISTVGDNVFLNDRNIWTFYRSCEHSELGLFWMKGMACFVFNPENGLIERAYINFDENDVIQPYFDQYLELIGTTI